MLRNKLLSVFILGVTIFSTSSFAKTVQCFMGDNNSVVYNWPVVYEQDRIIVNNTFTIFPLSSSLFRGSAQFIDSYYFSKDDSFYIFWLLGNQPTQTLSCSGDMLPKRFRNLETNGYGAEKRVTLKQKKEETPIETKGEESTAISTISPACSKILIEYARYNMNSKVCGWTPKHSADNSKQIFLRRTAESGCGNGIYEQDLTKLLDNWHEAFQKKYEGKSDTEVCQSEYPNWKITDDVD